MISSQSGKYKKVVIFVLIPLILTNKISYNYYYFSHADFKVSNQKLSIHDNTSSNGTKINGVKIAPNMYVSLTLDCICHKNFFQLCGILSAFQVDGTKAWR